MATPNTGKQPDMNAVPPAVRAQAAEAQRLQELEVARRNGKDPNAPPAPEPPVEGQPAPPAPTPEPPAQTTQPPAPPAPEPPAPPAPPAEGVKPTYEQLEQMFRSEQGRSVAFQRDVRGLQNQLDDMRVLLADMNRRNVPPATPPQADPPKIEWTPDELQEWGEALPVIEKKVQELIAPLEMRFRDAVANLQQGVEQVAGATIKNARQTMIETLNKTADINPGNGRTWQVINEEDGFVDWLQHVDPFAGHKRIDMLKDAWNNNDAARVAAFFRGFLKEAAVTQPPVAQPTSGYVPPAPAPALEQFVAPGQPRTAAPTPGSAEPEIITTGDVTRFYADVRAGRWKGREAEQAAYEAKIFAASKANAIRPGGPQP